ncbi:MAG: DMT family transporter [Acetobacterales bacterium]
MSLSRPVAAVRGTLVNMPPNLRGMFWMFFATSGLVTMGASLKFVSGDLPLATVILWRMMFTMIALAPWLIRHGRAAVATSRFGTHLVRSVLGFLSLAGYVVALTLLPLADVTAIGFTKPLWVVVIAVLMLGERIGWPRGIATMVGFCGVLVIARPSGGFDPYLLVAVSYAFFGALSLIWIKRLANTEPSTRILFYYALFSILVTMGPALYDWHQPTPVHLAWLAFGAMAGSIGQYCFGRALAIADASVVAPVDYSRILVASIIGFVLFHEVPTVWTFAGALVIFASTFYIGRREALKRKASAAEPGA